MVRVSVVVVNWNTRELLERCLNSVYASAEPDLDIEVIVVDNASSDGSASMVAEHFPAATLIHAGENLGFARANNLAIKRATGTYVLLLNPDAELLDGALAGMVRYLDRHPQCGMVGPRLLNSDGTTQSSRRRFPSRLTAVIESTVLQRWMPDNAALRRYYVLDRTDDDEQEVDWLVGACLLVRAAAVQEIGLLDEGYFMYFEETDWAQRLASAGWTTTYLPHAHVLHYSGQGSEQDLLRRHTRFQYSKCRYFEKRYGRYFAQALRIHLLANYLFLIAEDSVKLLLPGKRRMRLDRIYTLTRVVRWKLRWVFRWGELQP